MITTSILMYEKQFLNVIEAKESWTNFFSYSLCFNLYDVLESNLCSKIFDVLLLSRNFYHCDQMYPYLY